MLEKEEILNGLENKDIMVKNAMYEYVCSKHLYDDEKINEKFMNLIRNNYSSISYYELRYSKLNKDIIECIINILLEEDDEEINEQLSVILIEHYNLIKDMDYNFEDILKGKMNILMYKKIKHFSKKEPEQLMELYKNSLEQNYYSNDEQQVTEILRNAMGLALVQTKEGFKELMKYIEEIKGDTKTNIDCDNNSFIFMHMPELVSQLCKYADPSYYPMILDFYLYNMNFFLYDEECEYYFSNICNEEFINYYIRKLQSMKAKDLEEYYYDVAKYLNSEKIDDFLFEELKRNNDKELKQNIMCVLAERFDERVIPVALNFIEKNETEDLENIKNSIVPLLIFEQCDDERAKSIIEEVKFSILFSEKDIENVKNEIITNARIRLQTLLLKSKPHIKEYKKIRRLYEEIANSMMKYFYQGKFNIEIDNKNKNFDVKTLNYIKTEFNTDTYIGMQAMANAVIYKNASNMNCITEEFIEKNKYKNKEKIELLQSMSNSEAGLFEVTGVDRNNGQVHLKNVLNNKEYCITDIALSCEQNCEERYLYTRIITYHDISFGTGLILAFRKNDEFICNWINENLKSGDNKQEISRFIELYNAYMEDNNRINLVSVKAFKQ